MKAKKSLGQNFLKSQPAIKKIIEAGELSGGDTVLEIGPGKGVLTEKLLESGARVIAVEKDRELFAFLSEKFASAISARSLVLVHGDVLNFDTSAYRLEPSAYRIIANIPYNITGAILKKFLSGDNQPDAMILMIQQEVAERIVARSGKESILSISVKAYGTPKIVMKVPKRYFSPAPKVDSAVISIKEISKNTFKNKEVDEKKFWELVKCGFAHKRKVLAGNLRELSTKIDWPEALKNLNLNEKSRAEDLTLVDWINLYKNTHILF